MSIVALITWLIAAGLGSAMVAIWRKHGGLGRGGAQPTHLPPVRVFTHLGLAAAGLVVWIVYLVSDTAAWAWIALADLVIVAMIGSIMVRRWAIDGRAAMRGDVSTATSGDLAEQHISRPFVVLHGIFAVTTLVLVLLVAFGVAGS